MGYANHEAVYIMISALDVIFFIGVLLVLLIEAFFNIGRDLKRSFIELLILLYSSISAFLGNT